MNRFLLVAVALSASISATGCLPLGGCGGFQGAGDKVYTRGTDMLIVCTNGGYSATLGTATQEGRASSTELTDGPSGAIASDLTVDQISGGLITFGNGVWAAVALDQTALDHADALCADLVTRAWWNATALPVDTKFARPSNGFASTDECIAAQGVGSYPADAPCQDELDLCTDGTAILTIATVGDGPITGSYTTALGEVLISAFAGVSASYRPDGILLVGNQTTWSTKAVSPQAVSKCAQ